jgi:transcriptional regulator with GAF, ATPase, and Fis domain
MEDTPLPLGASFWRFVQKFSRILAPCHWPANTRKLRNVIARAVIAGSGAAAPLEMQRSTLARTLPMHRHVATFSARPGSACRMAAHLSGSTFTNKSEFAAPLEMEEQMR